MKNKTFIPLPSRQEILEDMRQLKDTVAPEDILKILARTYGLKEQARQDLRHLLTEVMPKTQTTRRKKSSSKKHYEAEVLTLDVTEITPEGDVVGLPSGQKSQQPVQPRLLPSSPRDKPRKNVNRLQVGDQILVKVEDKETKILRKIEPEDLILGVFHSRDNGHSVVPTSRKVREEFRIAEEDRLNAQEGDLVEIKRTSNASYSPQPWAHVIRVLGSILEPKTMSLIAIHSYNLPMVFPEAALELAEKASKPSLDDREDLRSIPLVTIDDEDARDFDDAIWAAPDEDLTNQGGWHLIVAIADVSHYVHPDDALDREALKRGNSVYFPDRVIPMLPEALSNELCSLKPQEDRACLAVHLWITCTGRVLRHRFTRALMRSAERLTYAETQTARDGGTTRLSSDFIQKIITPLYQAFDSLKISKGKRAPLNLDLPEERIYLNDQGKIERIILRPRFDSHRLIEEFMISANAAAAIHLNDKNFLCLYRVHDKPTYEKIESLRDFLKAVQIKLPKGQSQKPIIFNHIIEKAALTPYAHAVNTLVLRTQAQAIYTPENIGHFGLNLPRYAHFTSPIRRYADLLVHRALVATLNPSGNEDFSYTYENFKEIGEHISMTERRAAVAERETVDRYVSAYLSQDQGKIFQGRIVGVTDFALFLRLADSGADGMIPMRLLKHDYFTHDAAHHRIVGRRTRQVYALGDILKVKLVKADPLKGSLIFEPMIEEKSHASKSKSNPKSFKKSNHRKRKPKVT